MLQIIGITVYHGNALDMERKSIKTFQIEMFEAPSEALIKYLDGIMQEWGYSRVGKLRYKSSAAISWRLLLWMLNAMLKRDDIYPGRIHRIEIRDLKAKVLLSETEKQRTAKELRRYQAETEKRKAERECADLADFEVIAEAGTPMKKERKIKKVSFKIKGISANPDYSTEYVKICKCFLKNGFIKSRGIFISEDEIETGEIYKVAQRLLKDYPSIRQHLRCFVIKDLDNELDLTKELAEGKEYFCLPENRSK